MSTWWTRGLTSISTTSVHLLTHSLAWICFLSTLSFTRLLTTCFVIFNHCIVYWRKMNTSDSITARAGKSCCGETKTNINRKAETIKIICKYCAMCTESTKPHPYHDCGSRENGKEKLMKWICISFAIFSTTSTSTVRPMVPHSFLLLSIHRIFTFYYNFHIVTVCSTAFSLASVTAATTAAKLIPNEIVYESEQCMNGKTMMLLK